jgi:hypothetical protein
MNEKTIAISDIQVGDIVIFNVPSVKPHLVTKKQVDHKGNCFFTYIDREGKKRFTGWLCPSTKRILVVQTSQITLEDAEEAPLFD